MKTINKFRAWDEVHNKMVYQTNALESFERFFRVIGISFPLMQSTGFLVKSDKYVYDLDIVKFDKGSVGLIEWSEERFCYVVVWESHRRKWCKSLAWLSGRKNIEVIGNIYENPNLINQ